MVAKAEPGATSARGAVARFAIASGLLGMVVALLAPWLGIRHNPQGEFVDPETGALDLGYCLSLFCSGSFLVGTATFSGAMLLRKLTALARKTRSPNR